MMVSIGHVREVMERLLDTIASSLATMVAEADQATENKTALLNLATKSRDILEPQLEAIRSKLKAAKIDHVLPALTFLDTCLRDVLALIIKRGKKRDAVQLPVDTLMVKSSKVRAEIASAENNLFQALLFIMTALQIRSTQILEHQERKAAEDSVKTLHTGEPPWKLKFENLKYKTTMRGKPVDELTLGSGGFGLVFGAYLDGVRVAVKESYNPTDIHFDEITRKAFYREAHNHYGLKRFWEMIFGASGV